MTDNPNAGTISRELTEADQARIEHALVWLAESDDATYPTEELYSLAEYIVREP